MSVKASSDSTIRTIKIICDRCKRSVKGLRGEDLIAGLYEMTTWKDYRRENEQNVWPHDLTAAGSILLIDPRPRYLQSKFVSRRLAIKFLGSHPSACLVQSPCVSSHSISS